MTIYVLGSAGWIPGQNETSSLLIEHNNTLFLLDAGTGVANIRMYTSVLSKYDTVHVLFSHYHLDHTIGLIYLDPFVRDKKLVIYGPGKLAYPETNGYYIHALLRSEFFSRSIDNFSSYVQLLDYPALSFSIGETSIHLKPQKHSSPSFQIGLDQKMIYATDTTFDPEDWADVSAEVLFHECWDYTQSHSDRHTSLWQLKNQLPLDRFGKVVLIHQNPAWNDDDYFNIRTMISRTNIVLGEDGMCLVI